MKTVTTKSAAETKKLGTLLVKELHGGEVICLDGDLGTGKTTFTQGLLKGLGVKGPYTSPTFVIMKYYAVVNQQSAQYNIYHVDAYRVGPEDLLELGWKEIITDKRNVVIIEWSDRIKKILPKKNMRIHFSWVDKNKRQIVFS